MKRKLSELGIVALAVVAGGVAAWVSLTPVAAEECDCMEGYHWTPIYVGQGTNCTAAHADLVSQVSNYAQGICSPNGTCDHQHYFSGCWDCGGGLWCKSGRMRFRCECCDPPCDQHD